jgi:C1A family cysteine protease
VQNSWGTLWGDGGRFIIPFDFKFNEAWGVADDIVNDNLKKPVNNKIIKVFYKTINWIVNLFTSAV